MDQKPMNAQYKIHVIERFDTIARPFIVTTAFSNHGGYPKGEWFLAIPDDKSTFMGCQVSFDKRSFEESPLNLDEDFIFQEVLGRAENAFQQYVFEKHQGLQLMSTLSVPDLVEAEPRLLVHYWLRNQCANQLFAIKRNTQCILLQEYLGQVLELEPVVLRDVRI